MRSRRWSKSLLVAASTSAVLLPLLVQVACGGGEPRAADPSTSASAQSPTLPATGSGGISDMHAPPGEGRSTSVGAATTTQSAASAAPSRDPVADAGSAAAAPATSTADASAPLTVAYKVSVGVSSVGMDTRVPNAAGVLQGIAGAGRICYLQALERNPALAGKIEVTLQLAKDGSVTSANAGTPRLDAGLETCVLATARRAKFAADDARPAKSGVYFTITFARQR